MGKLTHSKKAITKTPPKAPQEIVEDSNPSSSTSSKMITKSPGKKKKAPLPRKRALREMQEEDEDTLEIAPPPQPSATEDEQETTEMDNGVNGTQEDKEVDEYEQDSSDEEDLRNTIGDVPVRWYDDYDHIGYDLAGQKIYKPERGDNIDAFLKRCDDPNFGRTVVDALTGQDVVLSDKDIDLIKQYRKGRMIGSADVYEPFEDFFTFEKMKHPVRNLPPHKRSFLPSLNDKRMVSKMVHAIKMGWLKPKSSTGEPEKKVIDVSFWDEAPNEAALQHLKRRIDTPRRKLPDHFSSCLPPPEYLFTKEEEEEWNNQDPEERMLRFPPRSYTSMRYIPTTPKVELFDWLQDLSLCPRQRKLKINVDPESLIPKLPQPQELKPFPSRLNKVYKGHTDFVRSISVDHGEWLASGSDDCTLRIWHIRSGHCFRTIIFDHKVKQVVWCPKKDLHLLAVVVENDVYMVDPKVDDPDQVETPLWDIVKSYRSSMEEPTEESQPAATQWRLATDEEQKTKGILCVVTHPKPVSRVVWHATGNYFVTITGGHTIFHKFRQFFSQKFSQFKGQVQDLALHPTKPFVFVATKTHLLVYNITTQSRVKKMLTNCQWISRLALHPLGDNVLLGSYENHVAWFDMEFSNKPYKMMRYHKGAIRSVAYHPARPLFASASDDGKIVVAHGKVYDDYNKNPLIVAVKVLGGHTQTSRLSVLDCTFHPREPWLFSSGADGNIHLYTDE